MENVKSAPLPVVDGYHVHAQLLNNRWLGAEQNRVRRFSFGTIDGRRLRIDTVALESPLYTTAVISGGGAPPHSSARGVGRRRDRAQSPRTVTSGVGGRSTLRGNERLIVPGIVTSSDGGASKKMWRYSIAEACQLQGVPDDMQEMLEKHAPFRADAKLKAIANGVPLWMGRAIARAVRRAMHPEATEAVG
jgi:DNA (cytosine-5)-methyltransferase 1